MAAAETRPALWDKVPVSPSGTRATLPKYPLGIAWCCQRPSQRRLQTFAFAMMDMSKQCARNKPTPTRLSVRKITCGTLAARNNHGQTSGNGSQESVPSVPSLMTTKGTRYANLYKGSFIALSFLFPLVIASGCSSPEKNAGGRRKREITRRLRKENLQYSGGSCLPKRDCRSLYESRTNKASA